MNEINGMEKMDYTDPQCPFCTDGYTDTPPQKTIPIDRVLSKLDEYFGKNDYEAAERHLLYWQSEAEYLNDRRGMLSVRNELMGLCRKLGRRDDALSHASAALELIKELDMGGTVTAATAYLNAGTVYKAFGMADKAVPLFESARKIYEESLDAGDARLGGLYNNMALALVDLSRFDEADALYRRALATMELVPNGEPDRAITYLNMADAAEKRYGSEAAETKINEYLQRALVLLDAPSVPRDGYYAFVCEKCAPSFGYYGWFAADRELRERARKIYEGD